MKSLFFILFISIPIISFSKEKINVYFFSGQGSDSRIFSKLTLDSNYYLVNIVMPDPEYNESITEYAQSLIPQIDTSKSYIFIGVSLGGMVCSELADILKPEKVIIISSAKCRNELPGLYKFQKFVPINKIVPKGTIKVGAQMLQPLVEPDRRKNKIIFKSMLKNKSAAFFKGSSNMIVNWDKETYNKDIIHIHGTKDHTLPIRNVDADYVLKGGSHMMTLTRGEELNELIVEILNCP